MTVHHLLPPTPVPTMSETERQLREYLAWQMSGNALCRDDGELMDTSCYPWIDYLRMAPNAISDLWAERHQARLKAGETMSPAPITVVDIAGGMACTHNMPCPVHPKLSAVYLMNTGVFHPSYKAQSDGWILFRRDNKKVVIEVRPWLFGILNKLFGIERVRPSKSRLDEDPDHG